MSQNRQYFDMDHALMPDGNIYRVLGNFKSDDFFLGYKLYSPAKSGDRLFRGQPYTKNYTEESTLPDDVLSTYDLVKKSEVVEFFDPIAVARSKKDTFKGTVWYELYEKLAELFGEDSIGIFGSALPGLHLNAIGDIKNDVDFFIQGIDNVPKLATHLKEVREDLGFIDYDQPTQQEICKGWAKVFRNENNSFDKIIDRRWSGMQLNTSIGKVLNTFRFRDTSILTPLDLINPENIIKPNFVVKGRVKNSVQGNLYPRMFSIEADGVMIDAYSMWWKYSSPVKDGDEVRISGNLVKIEGKEALLLTNYVNHWIQIK